MKPERSWTIRITISRKEAFTASFWMAITRISWSSFVHSARISILSRHSYPSSLSRSWPLSSSSVVHLLACNAGRRGERLMDHDTVEDLAQQRRHMLPAIDPHPAKPHRITLCLSPSSSSPAMNSIARCLAVGVRTYVVRLLFCLGNHKV